MTDNNTTDNNTRIAELLTELFLKAADDAAGKMAVGQDSIEELVHTSVNESLKANLDAWVNTKIEETVEEITDERVQDALDDRFGYDEFVTGEAFNDYLSESDVLLGLATEEYVDDSITDLGRGMNFATMYDLRSAIEELQRDTLIARTKTRIKSVFTLTRARIKSLLSFRISLKKVEG